MGKQFTKEGASEGTRRGWVVVRETGTKHGDESGEKIREERNVNDVKQQPIYWSLQGVCFHYANYCLPEVRGSTETKKAPLLPLLPPIESVLRKR